MLTLALCLIGLGVAALLWLDRPVLDLVLAEPDWLFDAARKVTDAGKSDPYLLAGAVLFLVWRFILPHPVLAQRALFVFVAVAASGLATDLLKIVFGRARPKLLLADGEEGFAFFRFGHDRASFPSGHATTAAALALALALVAPRWRWPAFLFGAGIAATRVVIHAHYLSDALFGAAVGTLTVWLLLKSRLNPDAPPVPRLSMAAGKG